MVARVVPNSVSMVAQTAPPSSVTVRKGRNRRFFLMRFGQGTSSGVTDPTLGGQAHDTKDFRASAGNNIGMWFWDESSLQTAGVGINAARSLAVAGFVESGITEYIWCWGTIENNLQSQAPQIAASAGSGLSYVTPASPLDSVFGYFSDNSLDYILIPAMFLPATIGVEDITDAVLVKGPVAESSYSAFLYETIRGDLEQFTFTLDAASTDAVAATIVLAEGDVNVSAPELPIHAVRTRSIDAKTIADRYNMGQPQQEDYLFGSGRKFYQ